MTTMIGRRGLDTNAAGLLTLPVLCTCPLHLSLLPVSAACLCCLHAEYAYRRMTFPAVLSQVIRSCCCARSRTRSFGAGRMRAIRSSLPAAAHVRGPRPSLASSDNASLRVSSVPSNTTLRPQLNSSYPLPRHYSSYPLVLLMRLCICWSPLTGGLRVCHCRLIEPGSHHGANPPSCSLLSVCAPALRCEGAVSDCGRMASAIRVASQEHVLANLATVAS